MSEEEAVKVLTRMLEVQNTLEKASNEQLANALVALTEFLTIDSYHYQVLMECAYRLAPEIFEET